MKSDMLFWMDPILVSRLVCFIACIGVAVSSLEWLIPATKLSSHGLIASGCFGVTRAERLWRSVGLRLLLIFRLACAITFVISVLLDSYIHEAGIAVFAAGLASLPLRLREPVGIFIGMDGAEHLLTSILIALGATFVLKSDIAVEAALIFVAMQGLLEYSSAGWTKLRDWKGWVGGTYLRQVFSSSNYGHPGVAELLKSYPALSRILSISVIAIEITVPFAFVLPAPMAEVVLLVALSFHIITAFTMGLNTFVWAFPATYPAILHCRNLLLYR